MRPLNFVKADVKNVCISRRRLLHHTVMWKVGSVGETADDHAYDNRYQSSLSRHRVACRQCINEAIDSHQNQHEGTHVRPHVARK